LQRPKYARETRKTREKFEMKPLITDSDSEKISYMFLSLLAEKINVLVVGGGKAALIKARNFAGRGCRVTVLAPDFCEELRRLDVENLNLREGHYERSQLAGRHLVIVATDDEAVNRQIQEDCEQAEKLYLTCSDYRNGQFVTPLMRESEEAVLALHTKAGSPKTSQFIAGKLQEQLRSYDSFIRFVCELRQQLKGRDDKDRIMKHVNSDEFFELFVAGKHHEFLRKLLRDEDRITIEIENLYPELQKENHR
jgi:precorrin-2 dehydrogenase/sirohydrochlorin ferrochelatase